LIAKKPAKLVGRKRSCGKAEAAEREDGYETHEITKEKSLELEARLTLDDGLEG